MAGTGMPNRGKLSRPVESAVVVAIVRRVFEAGGRSYIDCWDPATSQEWRSLAVSNGGGGPVRFIVSGVSVDASLMTGPVSLPTNFDPTDPLATDAAQAIIVPYGPDRRKAHVLGFVQHQNIGLVAGTLAPVTGADHTREVGVSDHCRANGGTRDILDERGAWTLDLTDATDPNPRVQMPAGGVFRIARDGSASERVVLGGPLLTYLAQLEAKVNELETLLRTATSIPAGGLLTVAPSGTSTPTADATLKAASVHISADAEAP